MAVEQLKPLHGAGSIQEKRPLDWNPISAIRVDPTTPIQ
jgi:hypothetical protein